MKVVGLRGCRVGKMCLGILVLFLLALISPAQALDCSDTSNMTQVEMNQCAGTSYEAADAKLNATWKKLFPRLKQMDEGLSAEEKGLADTVLQAQRNWIAFRDAHCRSEGLVYRGGSIVPLIVGSCLASLTQARTRQLEQLLPE